MVKIKKINVNIHLQLFDALNANMDANFHSSWITCLDEPMMVWLNQYDTALALCIIGKINYQSKELATQLKTLASHGLVSTG
jgi:hypothetical protein